MDQAKKEKPNCSWCLMRAISLRPCPINKADWKVQVSKESKMYAGKDLLLCNYHKNDIALKFDKVENLLLERF